MNIQLFQLNNWESLNDDQRLSACYSLARQLPDGWSFNRVEVCALNQQRHTVAFFDWSPPGTEYFDADEQLDPSAAIAPPGAVKVHGSSIECRIKRRDWYQGEFALIPGSTVTLGYDSSKPFKPTRDQLESWQYTQREYGAPDLHEYLVEYFTPLRTVSISPFLMEVRQMETRFLGIPLSQHSETTRSFWGQEARDKDLLLNTAVKFPHQIIAESRPYGFRLPTSDEWEWACAAGVRALWRWGNDCPTDGEPNHGYAAKDSPKWNLHLLPNAFGLIIAFNDYSPDLCQHHVMRGGDGGSSCCGGAGTFSTWLTLASSYFNQTSPDYDPTILEEGGSRRVFSLDVLQTTP